MRPQKKILKWKLQKLPPKIILNVVYTGYSILYRQNRIRTADLLHNCVCCSPHVETVMFIDKVGHVEADLLRKICENLRFCNIFKELEMVDARTLDKQSKEYSSFRYFSAVLTVLK